jgi:phosphohistidine swiveling domain-containing protein
VVDVQATARLDQPSVADVLHERSGPDVRWTTVNMAEVQPGVLSPLGWSFWRDPAEAGCRGAFSDLGVLPRREIPPPPTPDRRIGGLFFGRYAANLTVLCELADRIPGSSSEALEMQIFGRIEAGIERRRERRRYPVVAARFPVATATLRKRTLRMRRDNDVWWRAGISGSHAPPLVRIDDAADRLRRALRAHMLVTLLAQGCFDKLTELARSAGEDGLELELCTGYGDVEETRVSDDLWQVSRGTLSLEQLVSAHGYHGPSEGELSSRVWREDHTQLLDLCRSYQAMADERRPASRQPERALVRTRAEARLLAALPRASRPLARAVIRAASVYLPLREVGKASFLQAIDAARCAARELGEQLATERRLQNPEDVFALTLGELRAGAPPAAIDAIDARKRARVHLLELQLPERWTGNPQPLHTLAHDTRAGAVTGVPVSPGIAEGRARIIRDPRAAQPFEPGDILVCHTTDPSWVVLFGLAAAVVIDVGGPLSHGAIVARELGIPAVINTRTGTEQLRDGAFIRVDGSAGTAITLGGPSSGGATSI